MTRRSFAELLQRLRERRLEVNIEAWRRRRYIHRRLPTPCRLAVGRTKVSLHHRQTPVDNFALHQCFHEEQYQVPPPPVGAPAHRTLIERFHRDAVARGATPLIVDCGAHIGAASVWFSAVYPGSQVVAVEPSEENVAVLRRNVAGLPAEVIHAGIGPTDGEATLRMGPGSMDFTVGPDDGPEGRRVAVRSLRSVLGEGVAARCIPFILKVDIEGSEKELFRDADWDVFDRFPVIIVEGHDFAEPGRGTTSSLFRFHGARERDFLYGAENIFSIDVAGLRAGPRPAE